jgi:hypothetical protein
MHSCMIVCIMYAKSMHWSAFSMHQVCIFINHPLFPDNRVVDMQTLCRIRAHSAHYMQTLYILRAYLILKVCNWRTLHTLPKSASLHAHVMHTVFLVCKVCTMFQTLSGKSSKTPSNPTPMHTGHTGLVQVYAHRAYRHMVCI